ncbi:MAG TPA: STAS/SEC14 domain-containing protein [Blastocatellia bacterium]|nr:STAS/SEC14 domain-containing protein [Blastocatellia bacterium]
MSTSKTEQLLHAALRLPTPELKQFITRLLSLKARENAPVLSEREYELLLKVNQGLPPAMQQRLNELIDKRQSYTITDAELQELIQLTHQVEAFDGKRLESLVELAHLRQVPLEKLITQLGLKPVPHD